ncbi:hypothetical protein C8R46DRAFT_388327 [Mycena filopes]|nr:hypothetical protein C8R46DRAFT_388327 [Mycena filopes]
MQGATYNPSSCTRAVHRRRCARSPPRLLLWSPCWLLPPQALPSPFMASSNTSVSKRSLDVHVPHQQHILGRVGIDRKRILTGPSSFCVVMYVEDTEVDMPSVASETNEESPSPSSPTGSSTDSRSAVRRRPCRRPRFPEARPPRPILAAHRHEHRGG